MNREQLWATFLALNPRLVDGLSRLTPDSVRKMFDVTWNAAYAAGARDMDARAREISSGAGAALEEFFKAIGDQKHDETKKSQKKTDAGGK